MIVLLGLWQIIAMMINAHYILPSPTQILVKLWELKEPLFMVHLPATMGVTGLGLIISIIFGLALAILMDMNEKIYEGRSASQLIKIKHDPGSEEKTV